LIVFLNYAVKALIIVVGILFVTGVLFPNEGDKTLYRVMGTIFILYGIYRIIVFREKIKKYNFSELSENDDNEENDNEK